MRTPFSCSTARGVLLAALLPSVWGCSSDSSDSSGGASNDDAGTSAGASSSLGGAGNPGGGQGNGTAGYGSGATGNPGGGAGNPGGGAGNPGGGVGNPGGGFGNPGGGAGNPGGGAGNPGGGAGNAGGGAGNVPDREARVDNPFVGVNGYVNPEWRTKAAAEPGGDRVANTPTAVWLDRIAAIEGTAGSQSNGPMGLRDHLDAALAQGAGYAMFVIYDLPGRDCSALASNGELGTTELPRYQAEYIDPIAAILGDPKYGALRIVNVIEVDSLPNLVTNTSVAKCAEMKTNGGYVDGVAYALSKLGAFSNVYNYLDAGHHGWIGWDSNLGPTADLFAQTAKKAGMETVAGFITNSANYSALHEPFFDANTTVNGTTVKQAKWVDWNPFVDELSFAQALRDKLVQVGFDSKIGMLIDTSRNGWGGPNRPSAASSATSVDEFVNGSRIDRRIHAGNWCNQSGAGLGERPRAAPEAGIDAYVWVKPPGESDGASSEIPNNDGKGFDRMCDPTYGGNERNGTSMTGALANAPLSGTWFSAQFQELVRNANPPL